MARVARTLTADVRVRPIMHVVVDGWHLWGPSRDRGVGTYVRTLLTAVADRPDLRVTVTAAAAVDVPDGVEVARVPPRAPGPRGFLGHAWRTGAEADALGADVLHLPGLPPPARSRTPWAITVHDLFPLTHPASSGRRQRALVRLSLPQVRRAPAVVAPSAATADQLRAHGVTGRRIHVVPNALAPIGAPRVADRADHPAPLVVSTSSPDPRKQRGAALAAFEEVVRHGLPHRLALMGRLADDEAATLHVELADRGLADRVDVLGHVAVPTDVFARADALLVASSGEGFGFPALEASAVGTPVVAFANSATEEVGRGVYAFAPDGDVAALGARLVEVLTDPQHAERASRLGPALAADHDLDTFAQRLVDVWERVATSRT